MKLPLPVGRLREEREVPVGRLGNELGSLVGR